MESHTYVDRGRERTTLVHSKIDLEGNPLYPDSTSETLITRIENRSQVESESKSILIDSSPRESELHRVTPLENSIVQSASHSLAYALSNHSATSSYVASESQVEPPGRAGSTECLPHVSSPPEAMAAPKGASATSPGGEHDGVPRACGCCRSARGAPSQLADHEGASGTCDCSRRARGGNSAVRWTDGDGGGFQVTTARQARSREGLQTSWGFRRRGSDRPGLDNACARVTSGRDSPSGADSQAGEYLSSRGADPISTTATGANPRGGHEASGVETEDASGVESEAMAVLRY